MNVILNANGDKIHKHFINGEVDLQRVKEILSTDNTPLPNAYPKLWFSVYGGKIYITNLTNAVLKEYIL